LLIYADALARGRRYKNDYCQKIFNEFHARISWRLLDHEQPPLPLPDYNPDKVPEEEEVCKRKQIDQLDAVSKS
jgi:hypothetical protein